MACGTASAERPAQRGTRSACPGRLATARRRTRASPGRRTTASRSPSLRRRGSPASPPRDCPSAAPWLKPGSGSSSRRSTTPRLSARDRCSRRGRSGCARLSAGCCAASSADAAEQFLEQVEPAMDVADGIDRLSGRDVPDAGSAEQASTAWQRYPRDAGEQLTSPRHDGLHALPFRGNRCDGGGLALAAAGAARLPRWP